MSGNRDNYRLLIEKLDQFIRKYYVNQLIRGSLYSIGLILVLFLGISLAENYYFFPALTRKVMFYSFVGISGAALSYWVFSPLLHYFRLGRIISHEQAAQIIGQHFGAVQDKLLNVLQLKKQSENAEHKDLIIASINQKTEEITPVPFKAAINLSQNRRYLRYALPPLLLLLIILFAAPSIIRDSTRRLIANNREFEKPAPFSFVVQEKDLSVVQFEDFPLSVHIEGSHLPDQVFIEIEGNQYRLTKAEPNLFTYQFSNVQKNTEFRLFSSGIESDDYTLKVLKKPNILSFEINLDYPSYTQRPDEVLSNIGDLVVPAGTKINWVFNTQNTDNLNLLFSGEKQVSASAKQLGSETFTFNRKAMKSETYQLLISNSQLPNADSINYSLSVIPDLYPEIKAERFQDSADNKLLFFVGEASDDYGLLSLSFNYNIRRSDGKPGNVQTVKLPKPAGKQASFEYTFDLRDMNMKPGDEATYYFEVYDNDGVNGSKSSRTGAMVFTMPTVEEYRAMAEQNDKQVKQDLQKALQESRKIQQDMKKMREKMLQEKDLDWQNRKELEKMLERQKELQKQIEQAKEAYEENLKNQEEFSKVDEELMKKQEQIQKLFEEVMSEEMKELMKQIEELLQQLEKDQAIEMMEDFQFNDQEMEKELDRLLELFKQLELEQEMKETINQLEELAEEQNKLSEETKKEDASKPQEELQEKQDQIEEKFEDIKKQIDEIEKKNEALEQPKEMENKEQQMKDIQQDIDKSQQQLQQKQNSKASQSQKNASQKMQQMAQEMSQQMQSGEMEQMQEDMKSLRQLLENLVGLSFDQEGLMDQFGQSSINTPKYVELVQKQFKLKDDFRLVEDSLQALSKRVFQIESFVTEKVSEINGNMRQSLEELEERRKLQASDHQQRTMKNVNDLALMLSEVMNQMQQQMSSMMSGQQMCNNPGQEGRQPKDKISQGQQQLNDQMKRLRDQLEKGKGASSKEFAEMAAKQAALRKALREKQKELQQRGQGSKELQDVIDQMDRTETELVNKKLNNETMRRQQDILTRLLESEKAERERDQDEQRQSKTAEQKERKMPPALEEYIRKRRAEIEMYKTVSPALKPYYKNLVEEYFKSLQSAPK